MIPLGYMLKSVKSAPEWLHAPQVEIVYSLSSCVSENFADYIALWKHNGWWLFNSPSSVREAAALEGVDLAGLTLFYYEVFDREYDKQIKAWSEISPEPSIETSVVVPESKILCGYDIVTYYAKTSPECSPLSCNDLARDIPTNRFCLLDDFDNARSLLESGALEHGEPGPFRIVAVYTLPSTQT